MSALEQLAGNSALKHDLSAALQNGRLAHSILLVGEAGCGTGFAARCLAADYLYPNGGAHAEAVLNGQDTECLALRGNGVSGLITLGDESSPAPGTVRWARNQLQKTALSTDAAGRVLIIYGAQNLNGQQGECANALLKLIEEPPEGALFIFTAPGAAVVLPTIRSRCVAYTVTPVSRQECAQFLMNQKRKLPQQEADRLAFLYEGHIGHCVKALTDPKTKNALELAKELCGYAGQCDIYRTMQVLSRYSQYKKDREPVNALLWQVIQLCSAVLRQPGFEGLFVDAPEQAAHCSSAAADALQSISANVNLRAVMTVLAIELCKKN